MSFSTAPAVAIDRIALIDVAVIEIEERKLLGRRPWGLGFQGEGYAAGGPHGTLINIKEYREIGRRTAQPCDGDAD